jgi:hypothetical protein
MPCNQDGSEVEGSTPKGAGPLFCLDHAQAHAARTDDPAAVQTKEWTPSRGEERDEWPG